MFTRKDKVVIAGAVTAVAILAFSGGYIAMDRSVKNECPKLSVSEHYDYEKDRNKWPGKEFATPNNECISEGIKISEIEARATSIADEARDKDCNAKLHIRDGSEGIKMGFTPVNMKEYHKTKEDLQAANDLLRAAVKSGNDICSKDGIIITINEE